MIGRSHALCGILAGCGVAAVVPSAPWPVRILAVAVTGGAALLPDLDTPTSTAARSLGPVTRLAARAVAASSLAVYHATRTDADPADRRDGHRLATHTVPACLAAGAGVAVAAAAHPVGLVVVASLLAGLLGLGVRLCGASLAVLGGTVGWWATTQAPGWWWLYGAATTVGCLVHLAGDLVTKAGVPVWWPLQRGGRRWAPVTTPATFRAGGAEETAIVTPLLGVAVVLAAGGVSGVLPVLWEAALVVAGGE